MKANLKLIAICHLLSAICFSAFAQGTAFTYQGQLNDGGNPATGIYDLQFTIFDSTNQPGTVVAGPLTNSATAVSNGLFTVRLDFGVGVFTGPGRWLEIGARTNGPAAFSVLAPRQPIMPVPYAIMANSASNLLGVLPATQLSAGTAAIDISGNAAGFTGSLAGNVTGPQSATVVSTVGGVTAANVASGVNAANAATSANTINTIVKRDGSGNFSAGSITLAGNLNLPATTASAGIIHSGANTLFHTFGSGNTFAGVSAGNLTMSGSGNTGLGLQALQHNTIGVGSTAIGQTALANNTTGGNNVAAGFSALLSNTNGTDDTAVGFEALLFNTEGNFNTANGAFAMFYNTIGSENTASGFFSLYSNTNGQQNAAYGVHSLEHNTSGSDNTASGAFALYDNTSGQNNTADGAYALDSNTSGYDNTASGAAALYANTIGTYNTANGYQALTSNTNGAYNTASGAFALYANTSGYNNTANGDYALNLNTIGYENTASGVNALYNNTNGNYNTASGNSALLFNTTGSANTAHGYGALQSNTAGSNNIALGYYAGLNISTGSSNIDIGNVGASTDTNVIRIGTSQARTFIAGISGATAASGVQVFVNSSGQLGTLTSSERFKQDIRSMGDQSDVLLALRPVAFQYKPDIDPQALPQFGLIAEEVEKVDPDLVARDDQNQIYTVRYQAVDAMLLNEFLKEHRKVEEQGAEIQSLKQTVNDLKEIMNQLTARKGSAQ